MKLPFFNEWLRRKIKNDPDEDPSACNLALIEEAEKLTGRKWDGTQEDADLLYCQRLVLKHRSPKVNNN